MGSGKNNFLGENHLDNQDKISRQLVSCGGITPHHNSHLLFLLPLQNNRKIPLTKIVAFLLQKKKNTTHQNSRLPSSPKKRKIPLTIIVAFLLLQKKGKYHSP